MYSIFFYHHCMLFWRSRSRLQWHDLPLSLPLFPRPVIPFPNFPVQIRILTSFQCEQGSKYDLILLILFSQTESLGEKIIVLDGFQRIRQSWFGPSNAGTHTRSELELKSEVLQQLYLHISDSLFHFVQLNWCILSEWTKEFPYQKYILRIMSQNTVACP